jgi:hypothetical protein
MHKSLFFISLIVLFLASFSYAAAPFSMNIITNTLYQNTNTLPLTIYVTTHNAPLTGYLGNTISMPEVIHLTGGSVLVSGVVYNLTGYNMSALMLVKPGQYYKFNFTSASFYGDYFVPFNTTLINNTYNNTYLINTKTIEAPQYSTTAQILFALGIIISLILLFLLFRILKLNAGIIGGLTGFGIGMIGALLLIYSLQYTSLVQSQPYNIIAFNTILNVHVQSITTTPLAHQIIFGTMGYAFIIMDFILGFIYIFLAMLVYKEERNKRKYGR